MRIKISFHEAANYTAKHPETAFYAFEKDGDSNTLNKIGKDLKDTLIYLFFNGAENAAIYEGFNSKDRAFYYELMPN